MKVLLENLLRNEDGRTVNKETSWRCEMAQEAQALEHEIAFRPARVLMQDFTGVPAVVDLAAMRNAMQALGGDAEKINPLVPVDLVIDHSVIVELLRRQQSLRQECRRGIQAEPGALRLPEMGPEARSRISRVVPPGTGICHQVNLEYLAQTVWTRRRK